MLLWSLVGSAAVGDFAEDGSEQPGCCRGFSALPGLRAPAHGARRRQLNQAGPKAAGPSRNSKVSPGAQCSQGLSLRLLASMQITLLLLWFPLEARLPREHSVPLAPSDIELEGICFLCIR